MPTVPPLSASQVVIMTTREVVIMTTRDANNNGKVDLMTNLGFV